MNEKQSRLTAGMLERVESLVSQMLDGQLSRDECDELSQLLEASSEARRTYIDLVSLHVELGDFFAPPRPASASPVLGFLADLNAADDSGVFRDLDR